MLVACMACREVVMCKEGGIIRHCQDCIYTYCEDAGTCNPKQSSKEVPYIIVCANCHYKMIEHNLQVMK